MVEVRGIDLRTGYGTPRSEAPVVSLPTHSWWPRSRSGPEVPGSGITLPSLDPNPRVESHSTRVHRTFAFPIFTHSERKEQWGPDSWGVVSASLPPSPTGLRSGFAVRPRLVTSAHECDRGHPSCPLARHDTRTCTRCRRVCRRAPFAGRSGKCRRPGCKSGGPLLSDWSGVPSVPVVR